MITLNTLKNSSRKKQARKRVGRGPGSGVGKTCGRGQKGAGARSGWKSRATAEGGQFPLYRKLPIRGFSNEAFRKEFFVINLGQIEEWFEDGDVINEQTLRERSLLKGSADAIKILGGGELRKKVKIEAHAFSASAKAKLDAANIAYTISQ